MMRPIPNPFTTRRQFLTRSGAGFGMLGLGGLLERAGLLNNPAHAAAAPAGPLSPKRTHHTPKAKSVIWLFMYGGPSGFDLFDPKPQLAKSHGKKLDFKIDSFFPDIGPLMASPYSFKQYGSCGAWVCEKYPALAKHVDDIAFLKSCHAESNNHAPALFQMNTGIARVGFPSVGSWLTYGLGSENQSLPGYVVMYDHRGGPIGGPQNWASGFLPTTYQATPFRSRGTPILDLNRPPEMDPHAQRAQLDLLAELNEQHARNNPAEADLIARIQSYELAYRMQMEAPDVVDLSQETDYTKSLYGLDNPVTKYFGTQLLMARRMVERGVRFIQVYNGGGHFDENWDAHKGLKRNHDIHTAETDIPMAGLLADLKARGLLDSTLIVWGGEFGRLPLRQGGEKGIGRDHNPHGFLMWLAGGGVKGGVSHGETDEIGYKAVVDPTHVNDVHATILHLMGLDHKRLTYTHNGRPYRLTDVAGNVIHPILA